MSGSPEVCRRVIYQGRVQGVGFRHTVWMLARRYPVRGYVKNLRDGSVELVAVASEEVWDRFHRDIQQAFLGDIADCTMEPCDPGEEFQDFSIRF